MSCPVQQPASHQCCAVLCHAVPCCALQVTVDGPAGLITMPGTLAAQYQQMGGRVQLMGKPGPIIYAAAQQLAGGTSDGGSSGGGGREQQQQQEQQWLAIGDSLEHDIAG